MDYLLEIRYPTARNDLEDRVQELLFRSRCRGSSTVEAGPVSIVSCWFGDPESRAEARRIFGGPAGALIRELEQPPVDWLDQYQQSLEPLLIGRRLVVAPEPGLIPKGDRIPIIIPQERAFGTGSHESTALCLELMEDLDLDGRSGLDVGTGSGILAIAMAKLGAEMVVAFDNDLDTLGVVRRNLDRNAIHQRNVRSLIGTPDAIRGRFDLITMNILPEVIVPLVPWTVTHLREGGSLIVSGILSEQAEQIHRAASSAGLTIARELARGEWWGARLV
ncbi:MAG TPA: 50S ribosomal protein L11 methyltransferase [Thermoanaerobaculia bacterium]|nr:50S ribosomal protein L11 methyltransferase [Thermoanaerobaculia bacterium]